MRTGSLEAQNFLPESFDAITLWDVIDHIEKPQKFLENIYKLLKPGGTVVVETTMEDSLVYRIAHYMYILSGEYIKTPVLRCHPLHHSTFYSTHTMRKALTKAGFRNIIEKPGDLNPALINTTWLVRMFLYGIGVTSSLFNRPLETVFYARK